MQVMKALICLLLLTGLTLSAGELAGKWSGRFDITNSAGETKEDSAVMTLKIDGAKVSGTAGPNEDQQWTIQNGKLEAGKLTFEVAPEGDGNSGPDRFRPGVRRRHHSRERGGNGRQRRKDVRQSGLEARKLKGRPTRGNGRAILGSLE